MGQYYNVVNLDKKEFIHPHAFGDGAKLLEFGCSGIGMMTGLAILLADGNGRGGGDLDSTNPIIGSWAGDRIVIAGDYGDKGKFVPVKTKGENTDYNLHTFADDNFKDISEKVIEALVDDEYIKKSFATNRFYQLMQKEKEWKNKK